MRESKWYIRLVEAVSALLGLCLLLVAAFPGTAAAGEATLTDLAAESVDPEEDPLSVFTVNHGSRNSRKIAITMDDVYEPEWVWKSVELCKQYGITMTFFPVGMNLKEEDREGWQSVLDAGCEIGSHSSVHNAFHDIGEWIAISRLGKFQERLDQVLGYHYAVRWFRPPFGSIEDRHKSTKVMVRAIRTFGYEHILRWDVSETDPVKAFPKVRNGSILLFHARHKDYVCLTELIPVLLEAGFEPVTVSALFGYDPPEISDQPYIFDLHQVLGK